MYRVIKWVKGIPYLYEQSSFRVGKSVKTNSKFLGKASKDDLRTYSGSHIQLPETRDYQSKRKNSETKVITTYSELYLDNKINLEYYGISFESLRIEWESFTDHLRSLKFDLSSLPKIRMRNGKTVTCKQSQLWNYYVVTLPRDSKGNRTQFKSAFSHTLARIALDLLREQRPADYLQLASALNQSYWETQYALYTYILNSRDWKKRLKAFVFLWAGNTCLLEKIIPNNPQKIGLIDLSRRKDWKDEAVGIIALIDKTRRDRSKMGFASVKEEIHKELFFAKKDLETAKSAYKQCFGIEWINPYKKRAGKRLLQAGARLRSQEELCRKIYLIQRIFFP